MWSGSARYSRIPASVATFFQRAMSRLIIAANADGLIVADPAPLLEGCSTWVGLSALERTDLLKYMIIK